MSIKQKIKKKFGLAIINIKRYIPNRDNNRDHLFKTYIHKKTILSPQVLGIKLKNNIKLSLPIIYIKYHILSKNANGDNNFKTHL